MPLEGGGEILVRRLGRRGERDAMDPDLPMELLNSIVGRTTLMVERSDFPPRTGSVVPSQERTAQSNCRIWLALRRLATAQW